MSPKTIKFLLALLAALALAASLTPSLRDATARARASYSATQTDSTIRARNQSAFAQILGEVRATTSDLMFVKANRYIHAGVGYNLSAKAAAAISGNDEKKFQDCANIPTLIRSASKDFRGFLGALEREVKPYRKAELSHIHTSKAELIPWFRIMTLSNPHFIRAYRVGAVILLREDKWAEALKFINEGLDKNQDNPEVFLLYQTLAYLHNRGRYNKKYPWHKQWLDNAYDAAYKCYTLGKLRRPPQGALTGEEHNGLIWTESIEEDYIMGSHLAALLHYLRSTRASTDKAKKLQESRRLAVEQKEFFPEYTQFDKLVRKIDKDLADLRAEKETNTP